MRPRPTDLRASGVFLSGPSAGPPQAGERPLGAGAKRLGGDIPAPGRPKLGSAPWGQERSDWGATFQWDEKIPRMRFILAAALLIALTPSAFALDVPTGKVVLSITGEITHRNADDGAHFDMAMLEKLPQRSFTTKTPWYPEPRKFTGVLLRDLLAAVGSQGNVVRAVALNDYRVDIPVDDATRHDVLVAYWLDDKPMPVRDKGPLAIMYPFDAQPALRTAIHYSRAAWQLKLLELR